MKTQMVTGSMRRSAAILAIAIAVVGCTGAKSTQQIVILPTASPTESPTEEPIPTPTPSASPSASPSGSPSASPSASLTPSASTGGVDSCTATADKKQFFTDHVNLMTFDVYCASLPSTWWINYIEYGQPNGGLWVITYKNSSGALIWVGEGNFCSAEVNPSTCWASTGDLGTASFGPLSGSLKSRAAGPAWKNAASPGTASGPVYAIYVDAGTNHGYQIVGQGMSQSNLVAWAAAMVKFPKS